MAVDVSNNEPQPQDVLNFFNFSKKTPVSTWSVIEAIVGYVEVFVEVVLVGKILKGREDFCVAQVSDHFDDENGRVRY